MKNVRLNNGVMMPAIGFGIFQIPENETERIVNDAIETGYINLTGQLKHYFGFDSLISMRSS